MLILTLSGGFNYNTNIKMFEDKHTQHFLSLVVVKKVGK